MPKFECVYTNSEESDQGDSFTRLLKKLSRGETMKTGHSNSEILNDSMENRLDKVSYNTFAKVKK